MSEEQKKLLEQQLWNIAKTLRGKMDADEFRDYILGFIFYKYLSEKIFIFANNELKEDGFAYNEIDEKSIKGKEYLEAIKEASIESLGYFLKPSDLFSEIAKKGNSQSDDETESNFILEDLARILKNIEQSTMGTASEDDFDHLFEDLDLTSTKLGKTEKEKNNLIAKVLEHLDKISFNLEDPKSDVLGDAYEYLIAQFASGAGKKAGEFYTPQQVSTVLAKLVTTGKKRLKSVYDPTCGSGSLLLRVKREVEDVSNFYGQELNRTTYNLARMNMILHGIHYQRFNIKQEDTLEHPQHIDQKFEAIVANPPFTSEWSSSLLFMSDDRFSQYGKLAPKSHADYAFVQHMIHHLSDNGIMAVVLPHGALYRGGAEKNIRQYLIENRNYLDAVIGLPSNIFYGTTTPTCILVFKKCRENNENILFIDASHNYGVVDTKNYLRDIDIEKIITTYNNRSEIIKYSYLSSINEIAKKNYNLPLSKYVNPLDDDVEIIDIDNVIENFSLKNKELEKIDQAILNYCTELGISHPNGNNIFFLEKYKLYVIQKILSREIFFKNKDGQAYDSWEIKELGELLDYEQPSKYIVNSTDYDASYAIPVLTAGKTFILGYTNETTGIFIENLPVIIFDDFTTATKYVDFKFKVKSSAMKILKPKSNDINVKYVYEAMQLLKFPSVEHKRYWISEYQYLTIDVPVDMEEQDKIANFLLYLDKKISIILN